MRTDLSSLNKCYNLFIEITSINVRRTSYTRAIILLRVIIYVLINIIYFYTGTHETNITEFL